MDPEAKQIKRGAATERIAGELMRIGTVLLVRNHSATEEVREAVKSVARELEATATLLRDAARLATSARDDGIVQSHLALLQAKDRIQVLEELVKRGLVGAATSATFIGETARVKLALARMDAVDLFEEKRLMLLEERRRFHIATEAALADVEARLSGMIEDGDDDTDDTDDTDDDDDDDGGRV